MGTKTNSVRTQDILEMGGVTSIAVASQAVVWSESFGMPRNSTFGIEYKCTSTTPKVMIEMEQGSSQLSGAGEGKIDSSYVVPDDAGEIDDSLEDELLHSIAYAPVAIAYGRFKITGLSGNDADSVIDTLKVSYVLNI